MENWLLVNTPKQSHC